jgi:hypothetical protein
MKTWKRIMLVGLCTSLLLGTALPALAAPAEAGIPPLSQWPIIGPIIRFIQRIIKKEPAVPEATPEPNLPEITIETLDDILALRDLESNKRVRIIATDTALTTIVKESAGDDMADLFNLAVTFAEGYASLEGELDGSVLENIDADIPISLDQDLYAEATLSFSASECRAMVNVDYVSVNDWSIGLRSVAQEWLNSELPGIWPSEICVEHIAVEPGVIKIVGYRK